jgi:hypothetical protein
MLGILNSTLPAVHSQHNKSLMRLSRSMKSPSTVAAACQKEGEICFVTLTQSLPNSIYTAEHFRAIKILKES